MVARGTVATAEERMHRIIYCDTHVVALLGGCPSGQPTGALCCGVAAERFNSSAGNARVARISCTFYLFFRMNTPPRKTNGIAAR